MRKFMSLLLLVVIFMFCGCAGMVSKMLVPDVDTHLRDTELAHLKTVNADFNNKIIALADKATDKKTKLALAKILYKGTKGVIDIKPSAAENMMQQYARMVGREGVEKQIGVGIEWTKGLVSQVAGGGVAGVGGIGAILALLRRGNKKEKALKMIRSEADKETLDKFRKAAAHTGLEKEIG